MKWTGATNDIVAYKQTALLREVQTNPEWSPYHMVLDEAYSSIGGDQHLCPYSIHQLRRANGGKNGEQEYLKMLAFNNRLSGQRITIERAFGMLVRRWGILWNPLRMSIHNSTRICTACVRLHNFCIERWLVRNPGTANLSILKLSRENATMFVDVNQNEQHADIYNFDDDATDRAVMEQFSNQYVFGLPRASTSTIKRDIIKDTIFNYGFIYARTTDHYTDKI